MDGLGAKISYTKKPLLLLRLGIGLFFSGIRPFDITLAVLLLEAFDSPGGIDKFLLARVKRMAHRADFRVDFLGRAARLEGITATAMNHDLFILWMNIFFHSYQAPKSLNSK